MNIEIKDKKGYHHVLNSHFIEYVEFTAKKIKIVFRDQRSKPIEIPADKIVFMQ